MEGGMYNYSEMLVLFLLVPVLMQIVLPLIMLAVYGVGKILKAMCKRQRSESELTDDMHTVEKMRASTTV